MKIRLDNDITLMLFLMFIFCNNSLAQVPEPTALYIEDIQGEGIDNLSRRTYSMNDGFITTFDSRSKTGNISMLCNVDSSTIYIKYKDDGYTKEWVKCSSGAAFIRPTLDGNFILCWNSGISGPTSRDLIVRKETFPGSVFWLKEYGGSASEIIRDLAPTNDGGFIAAIETNSSDGDIGSHYGTQFTHDIWAVKIDSVGNKVWGVVLGGSDDERPSCVVPNPDGGCYILGYTLSSDYDCSSNHGSTDVFIARLDASGNKIWAKCFGGSQFDGSRGGATSLWGVPDGNGGALVTASTNSGDGDITNLIGCGDFWLFNIDNSGNVLWDNCYGGPTSDEFPQTLCKAPDGSIWIGGASTNSGGQVANYYGKDDAWLVHTDNNGNFLSAKVMGTKERDVVNTLHPLTNGLVIAGGTIDVVNESFPFPLADIYLARIAPWITEVQEISRTNYLLAVYPNPANNIVHFTLNERVVVKHLSIFDMSGKKIFKSNAIPPDGIDVKDWAKGLYEVRLKTTIGNISTKLIIQ